MVLVAWHRGRARGCWGCRTRTPPRMLHRDRRNRSRSNTIRACATSRCRTGAQPTSASAQPGVGAPICTNLSPMPTAPNMAGMTPMAVPGSEGGAMNMTFPAFRPRVLAALSVALLGGCASFSPDGGFDAVQHSARAHIPQDLVWSRDDTTRSQAQARIDTLLEKPLAADDAVQIALLNNPGLQAAFNTLGVAEAERVAASRLPNPGLSISRLTQDRKSTRLNSSHQ